MIDLNDPGFELFVEEDVKTENFKAHRVLDIVRLARSVRVCQLGLHSANSLNDCRFDIVEHPRRIMPHFFDIL